MVDIQYKNAFYEVLQILKRISVEDYNKIPKDKINLLENFANKDFNFNYNPRKTLDEQNVSEIAKVIIADFFRDYWATPEQKARIVSRQEYNRRKFEEEKNAKYNPNDIFKNTNNEMHENVALIDVKKENWYKKIIGKIKNLFRKKS